MYSKNKRFCIRGKLCIFARFLTLLLVLEVVTVTTSSLVDELLALSFVGMVEPPVELFGALTLIRQQAARVGFL